MSPTGDLLVTSIFRWGGAHSSLLSGPCVLRWHSTLLVAAHPSGVTKHSRLRDIWSALLKNGRWPAMRESCPGLLDVAQPLRQHRPRPSFAQRWRCHKCVASDRVRGGTFVPYASPSDAQPWRMQSYEIRAARFSTCTKSSLDMECGSDLSRPRPPNRGYSGRRIWKCELSLHFAFGKPADPLYSVL